MSLWSWIATCAGGRASRVPPTSATPSEGSPRWAWTPMTDWRFLIHPRRAVLEEMKKSKKKWVGLLEEKRSRSPQVFLRWVVVLCPSLIKCMILGICLHTLHLNFRTWRYTVVSSYTNAEDYLTNFFCISCFQVNLIFVARALQWHGRMRIAP